MRESYPFHRRPATPRRPKKTGGIPAGAPPAIADRMMPKALRYLRAALAFCMKDWSTMAAMGTSLLSTPFSRQKPTTAP